ncbi:low density lipoprotein receptor adapter protein 1b isoform X2 [Osmerus eperlanus]
MNQPSSSSYRARHVFKRPWDEDSDSTSDDTLETPVKRTYNSGTVFPDSVCVPASTSVPQTIPPLEKNSVWDGGYDSPCLSEGDIVSSSLSPRHSQVSESHKSDPEEVTLDLGFDCEAEIMYLSPVVRRGSDELNTFKRSYQSFDDEDCHQKPSGSSQSLEQGAGYRRGKEENKGEQDKNKKIDKSYLFMAGIKACRVGKNIRDSCLQPLDTSSPLVSRRENMPSPLSCVEGKPLLTPKTNKSQAEVFEQYSSFTLEDCSYSLFDTGEGTEGTVGGPKSATMAPRARAVCAETNAGKGCGLPSVQDCPVSSVDKKVTMEISKRITRSMQPQIPSLVQAKSERVAPSLKSNNIKPALNITQPQPKEIKTVTTQLKAIPVQNNSVQKTIQPGQADQRLGNVNQPPNETTNPVPKQITEPLSKQMTKPVSNQTARPIPKQITNPVLNQTVKPVPKQTITTAQTQPKVKLPPLVLEVKETQPAVNKGVPKKKVIQKNRRVDMLPPRPVIREDFLQQQRRYYVGTVNQHNEENMNVDQRSVRGLMQELLSLMDTLAAQGPGFNGQPWQHPSDLTCRNYRVGFGNIIPRYTLVQWKNKSNFYHKRFAKVPLFFERSPIP